jgi:hypothetical protein
MIANLNSAALVAEGISKPRRNGFVPFSSPCRFVIDLLQFHPDGDKWNTAKWQPKHLLSVPVSRYLEDVHPHEELQFSNNEQPLLSREDAIATVATWNRGTQKKLETGADDKYLWYFVIELGFATARPMFAVISHGKCEFDLLGMRFRLVKPTAAEVAQHCKDGVRDRNRR